MSLPTLARTGLAVVATAVAGGVATSPSSDWYRGLRKPSWQPPPPAFGLVLTPLHATVAAVTDVAVARRNPRPADAESDLPGRATGTP